MPLWFTGLTETGSFGAVRKTAAGVARQCTYFWVLSVPLLGIQLGGALPWLQHSLSQRLSPHSLSSQFHGKININPIILYIQYMDELMAGGDRWYHVVHQMPCYRLPHFKTKKLNIAINFKLTTMIVGCKSKQNLMVDLESGRFNIQISNPHSNSKSLSVVLYVFSYFNENAWSHFKAFIKKINVRKAFPACSFHRGSKKA